MSGDTGYLMTIDDGSKNGRRSLSPVWWIGAAVVCLLLLLLTVILVAHNTSAINKWETKYETLINNLTKDKTDNHPDMKKICSNNLLHGMDLFINETKALEAEHAALKIERDELKTQLSNLTEYKNALNEERDALRNERGALTAERGALKDERDSLKRLTVNLTKDRDTLWNEHDALRDERDGLKRLTLNLTKDRDALWNEHDALRDERDGLKRLTLNLTKDRDALWNEHDALRDERDGLKRLTLNLTKEMEALQRNYKLVVASRNRLQAEVNRLNLNQTVKTCIQGWSLFNNTKCYYFSREGQSETWEKSRQDCQERGAELAMPKTKDELKFVSRGNSYTWIGLTDKANENVWMWVDGTELEGEDMWKEGEPNNTGDEDCAEVSRSEVKLNDAPCKRKFSWACEA